MRVFHFMLVAFAFAGVFIGIVAASGLVARAVRAQLSVHSHRSGLSVPKHRHDLGRVVGSH
jgi:hypothetical protein